MNNIRQVAIVAALALGASVALGTDSDLSKKAAARRLPDWPNLEEVIIVSKCHLDAGYTMPVPQLQEKIRKNDCNLLIIIIDKGCRVSITIR